jgi:hypothetical protein
LVGEAPDLEVYEQQAAQCPVVEDQVHAEPGVVEPQPTLTTEEGEVVAELEEELGQVCDESVLEVALGVLVLQPEELEHERLLDGLFRCASVDCGGLGAPLQHRGLVLRERGALVVHRVDLPAELSDGPAVAQGLGFVEATRLRALNRQQLDVRGPRERERVHEQVAGAGERRGAAARGLVGPGREGNARRRLADLVG